MEMIQEKLDSGLRIILIPRAYSRTVSTRFYIRAGSRYDGNLPGISHLLEHLLFSGTTNKNSYDFFSSIESSGGELNAHTSREYMCLYTNTLDNKIEIALQVLSEIVNEPHITQEKIDLEKIIVAKELKHAKNKPDAILDLFLNKLWQHTPLRNPIIGRSEKLKLIKLNDITGYFQKHFVSKNSLLVICGNIDPEKTLEIASNHFFDYAVGDEIVPQKILEEKNDFPKHVFQHRDIPQSHILIGIQAVSMAHPDRSPLKIIELLLNRGASGLLYKRLRTDLNLVYHINAFTSLFEDTGVFCIRAICDPTKTDIIQNEVFKLWDDIRNGKITETDLDNAKNYYTGTLYRQLETNSAIASITGIETLLGYIENIEQAINRINNVEMEDIHRIANAYLMPERSITTIIGPDF